MPTACRKSAPRSGLSFINVSSAAKNSANVTTRDSLAKGDVFTINKNKAKAVFAHMGQRTIPPSNDMRWQSLNLVNGEESSTSNGNTPVTIVGYYTLEAVMGPGYENLL
jgi:hypothetical protein